MSARASERFPEIARYIKDRVRELNHEIDAMRQRQDELTKLANLMENLPKELP